MRFKHKANQQLILQSLSALICFGCYFIDGQHCNNLALISKRNFSLVRRWQLSRLKLIALENTQSLEECIVLAKRAKGLAFNYSPVSRRNMVNHLTNRTQLSEEVPAYFGRKTRRRHYWQQPEEFFSCHILECPENSTYKTLHNDSRFDYYSLYGRAPESSNYSCIPAVGLFQLYTQPTTYKNAASYCLNNAGSLAHVASEKRTNGLAKVLALYNDQLPEQRNDIADIYGNSIYMAYVGLHFNRSFIQLPSDFLTPFNESLKCFLYRAWDPGHPRRRGVFANASCVAITTANTWVTVDCEKELPFICEIHTSETIEVLNEEHNSKQWQ